jgi:serine palmitoyltransferase
MERDISIVNHVATYHYTGRSIPCLNLSSYNYLGFSQKDSPYTQALISTLQARGCSTTSTRLDYGTVDLHRQLEGRVASFVGTEDAMILPMGYATNSTVLPALVGPGCLIISDSYNHASLVVGSRVSGAKITIFQHNNPTSLEKKLREAITAGQPRTRRPWVKILIVVEGIYSMEGEILRLREIVDIKKRYKAYLYVDEAHSIGALGVNGRGVCEHSGVDPADVDVLMGTFTKSFASVGGYIAGSKQLVSHLRRSSHSHLYDCSMSSAAACQVLCALDVLEGDSGKRRVDVLRQNALLFRSGLRAAGFTVLGDDASPVVPVLFGSPCKYTVFSRQCLARGIAVVIVGFPATPVLYGRVRFCVSAGHTREDLLKAIQVISEVGDIAMMRYNRHNKVASLSS